MHAPGSLSYSSWRYPTHTLYTQQVQSDDCYASTFPVAGKQAEEVRIDVREAVESRAGFSFLTAGMSVWL